MCCGSAKSSRSTIRPRICSSGLLSPPDHTWTVRATFAEPGTYVLRALAHDGGLVDYDDVTVTVR